MGVKRALHALGVTAVMGTLLLVSVPEAHADSMRDRQWALQAYKAQQAIWPISTGKGVTVAVIDSGVRATHVDLAGQVLPGQSFMAAGATLNASTAGHGTMVASLIAAHGHGPSHSDGVIGLAPDSKILPLTINGQASDNDVEVAKAIHYAVDHGASVINMSIASIASSPADLSAVAYAEKHDVILVAGSGNDGVPVNSYPASYPGVVSVGGSGQNGKIWSGSDYGPHLVLVAPATGIVGADYGTDTQYSIGDGTSYATAYVSATAALIRSKYPDLTAGQVINRLIKTATDPNAAPGQTTPDPHYGYGIMRPDRALTDSIPAGPAAGPLQQAVDPSVPSAPAASVTNTAAPSSSSNTTAIALIAAAVAVVVLIGVVVLILVLRRRKQSGRGGPPQGGTPAWSPYGQGGPSGYGPPPSDQQHPQ